MESANFTLTSFHQAEEILNKQSGFKALTGTTDFAKIASSDDPKCKLAYNLFIDRILNYIGAYYVKLGGKVDALVFAGGIGEKSSKLRADIIARCECLGFAVDGKTNDEPEDTSVFEITGSGAKHKTLIVQTDEQVSRLSNHILLDVHGLADCVLVRDGQGVRGGGRGVQVETINV